MDWGEWDTKWQLEKAIILSLKKNLNKYFSKYEVLFVLAFFS